MNQANNASWQPPLWVRLLDIIFVAIAIVDFYDSLVLYPVIIIPALAPVKPIAFLFNAVITLGALALMVILFIRWQRASGRGEPDDGRRHAWYTGIIRYWLAVEIFNYGFAKVLGTQFAPNYFRADSTWGSLPGFDLTWNFFGYSSTFANILAFIQLAGSAFLLFRRTTMLGIIFLLPVMVNIVLIDIFFGIPSGALGNACLFTAALIYLLTLHYQALVNFFRQTQSPLPVIRLKGLKNLLRICLALYAFGFIYFVTTTRQPAKLWGKWKVEQMVANRDTLNELDWLHNAQAWKNIYLEEYGRATFTPNPYVVEKGRSTIGLYHFDDKSNTITFSMHPDTGGKDIEYQTSVQDASAKRMRWMMTNPHDTIELILTKEP